MITKCHNCICNVCTKFRCPHRSSRCRLCLSYEFNKIYDCDYFESKFTAPRRYKIRRISKPIEDKLNQKLDYIIESLNLIAPIMEAESGTFQILYQGMIIFSGDKREADKFINQYQSQFVERLVLKKVNIDI